MAVIFNKATGRYEQDNDPATTLNSEYTPQGLEQSGGSPWASGEAMQGYAALAQAMIAAQAQKEELMNMQRLEQNNRYENYGDRLAGTLMRGGANSFDRVEGEADAISTILGRIQRR